MQKWHRWLAVGMAVVGVLSACGDGDSANATLDTTTNVPGNDHTAVTPPPVSRAMTLAEAIEAGAVTLAAAGQSLTEVRLTVTATQPVQLTIPMGTLLASGDAGTQNMMTAETKELSLEGTHEAPATEEITIAAFCINFHRAIPSGSSSFSLAEVSGETQPLKALTECLANQQADQRAKQLAIWAISDRFAFQTAEQNVAENVARASPAEAAEAEDVYRAFFEEIRVKAGPLLERCGYTLANLPLFA